MEKALLYNLHCNAIAEIIPVVGKKTSRCILLFEKKQKKFEKHTIVIRNINYEFTEQYKVLTKDYYLNL